MTFEGGYAQGLRDVLRLRPEDGTRKTMTPLHVILVQAMEDAKRHEPGLTESEIAARAGLDKGSLARAKKACGGITLAAVLDVLGYDIALKRNAAPSKK